MVRRRDLLRCAAGTVASATFPLRLVATGASATVMIVLFAPSGAMRRASLDAALSVFSARGISVAVALPPGAPPLPPGTGGAAPVNTLFRAPAALPPEPYFQMRELSRVRAGLVEGDRPAAHVTGLCAPDPGGDPDLRGLRVAGFRMAVLVPASSAPTKIETQRGQTVVTRGGHWVQPGEAGALRRYLDAAIDDPDTVHANLFVDLDIAQETARELAGSVALAVSAAAERGALTPLAPHEIGVRHFSFFERLIAVLVDGTTGDPSSRVTQAAVAAMSASLAQAGIPHSGAVVDLGNLRPADCVYVGSEMTGPGSRLPRGLACAIAGPERLAQLAALGTQAVLATGPGGLFGIDGDGLIRLRAPERAASWQDIEAIAGRLSLVDEPVIALDAAAFATPAQRNAATAALRRLSELPGTRLVDLADYAEQIANPDPVFQTMRLTRIAAPAIAPDAGRALTSQARAALMQDARRAWGYFTALEAPQSGMPSASCQFQPGGAPAASYDSLTQWDVGSVIFGWMAAHDLGIVGTDAFMDWRARALAALRATTLDDPRLPCVYFPIGAPGRRSPGYNARDAGRLLSALYALDRRAPAGDTAVRDLVAGWDIGATIIDGVPHSLENGRLVPEPDSHASSYLAQAFWRWGIAVRPGYGSYNNGATTTDRRMRLLHEAAEIGNFGAEPMLLEALELGWSAQIRYLADVLFAAQMDVWQSTGRIYAPSESSREQAPWFTYQGLRVDRTGEGRWDVAVPGNAAEYLSAEFREKTRMVASKAPFLWVAAHPHPFSDRMLAYAREHARLSTGFASGIYTLDNHPTRDYSDVNTNGIILQAIAAILAR